MTLYRDLESAVSLSGIRKYKYRNKDFQDGYKAAIEQISAEAERLLQQYYRIDLAIRSRKVLKEYPGGYIFGGEKGMSSAYYSTGMFKVVTGIFGNGDVGKFYIWGREHGSSFYNGIYVDFADVQGLIDFLTMFPGNNSHLRD